MINISELTQIMASVGIASNSDLVGVTEQEIRALEGHFGVKLPQSYQAFLSHMGRSAGYLSPWMAIYFDDLKEIREQFDLLNATLTTPATLPSHALIIANWESVFDFIVCGASDDPEVYRLDLCHEGIPNAKCYAPAYSEYLLNMARSANINEIPSDLLEDMPVQGFTEDTISY